MDYLITPAEKSFPKSHKKLIRQGILIFYYAIINLWMLFLIRGINLKPLLQL
jgi:hypothetical protein